MREAPRIGAERRRPRPGGRRLRRRPATRGGAVGGRCGGVRSGRLPAVGVSPRGRARRRKARPLPRTREGVASVMSGQNWNPTQYPASTPGFPPCCACLWQVAAVRHRIRGEGRPISKPSGESLSRQNRKSGLEKLRKLLILENRGEISRNKFEGNFTRSPPRSLCRGGEKYVG